MKIQKMDLLIALYTFCILVAETMGGKTFPVANIFGFQLNASVAIFVIPLLFSINDIVVEVHGAERARSIIRSGLLMIGMLFLFTLLAINLPPSLRFMNSEAAYDTIFSQSARISLASLTAFALADFLDVLLFVKIRRALGKKSLWLRNNLSNFVAQFIDTTVFMSLAFYALNKPFNDNLSFLLGLIIPYWLLKCSMSIIETPLVYIGVKWLKKDTEKK